MKIWESHHIFEHPWETITQACWRKYPNPSNKNVLAIDTLERSVDPVAMTVTSKRLFASNFGYPRWIGRIVRIGDILYSVEESRVDLKAKTMVLETTNLSLGNVINCVERLEYRPHPTENGKTLLTQSAVINVFGLPLIGKLEDFMANMIATNAKKGRHAMEAVITKIGQESADLAPNPDYS